MADFEMDELKREFLAEAGEKGREIEATLSSNGDADVLQRLAYLAHQLKGSGGSYGYAPISKDAAEIESTVEAIIAGEASFDGARGALQRCAKSLREYIARSARSLSSPKN